jgi:hypothetical protein
MDGSLKKAPENFSFSICDVSITTGKRIPVIWMVKETARVLWQTYSSLFVMDQRRLNLFRIQISEYIKSLIMLVDHGVSKSSVSRAASVLIHIQMRMIMAL